MSVFVFFKVQTWFENYSHFFLWWQLCTWMIPMKRYTFQIITKKKTSKYVKLKLSIISSVSLNDFSKNFQSMTNYLVYISRSVCALLYSFHEIRPANILKWFISFLKIVFVFYLVSMFHIRKTHHQDFNETNEDRI